MLLDHLYATVLHDHLWLTYVGRIAFPLFAFELVQGYMHTHDLRRYAKRILLLAVLSEIPFDMVAGASFFYIWHQNVAWTLLAGLGACCCADHLLAKETAASRRVLYLLGLVGTVLLPCLLMTDYGAEGVLLILLFWFTRKGGAVNYLIQVVVMFVMWQFVRRCSMQPMPFIRYTFSFSASSSCGWRRQWVVYNNCMDTHGYIERTG